MNPEDPEQYIRDLERGVGQGTPGATPPPFGTDSGSPSLRRRFWGAAKLAATPPGRLILAAIAGACWRSSSSLVCNSFTAALASRIILLCMDTSK